MYKSVQTKLLLSLCVIVAIGVGIYVKDYLDRKAVEKAQQERALAELEAYRKMDSVVNEEQKKLRKAAIRARHLHF